MKSCKWYGRRVVSCNYLIDTVSVVGNTDTVVCLSQSGACSYAWEAPWPWINACRDGSYSHLYSHCCSTSPCSVAQATFSLLSGKLQSVMLRPFVTWLRMLLSNFFGNQ